MDLCLRIEELEKETRGHTPFPELHLSSQQGHEQKHLVGYFKRDCPEFNWKDAPRRQEATVKPRENSEAHQRTLEPQERGATIYPLLAKEEPIHGDVWVLTPERSPARPTILHIALPELKRFSARDLEDSSDQEDSPVQGEYVDNEMSEKCSDVGSFSVRGEKQVGVVFGQAEETDDMTCRHVSGPYRELFASIGQLRPTTSFMAEITIQGVQQQAVVDNRIETKMYSLTYGPSEKCTAKGVGKSVIRSKLHHSFYNECFFQRESHMETMQQQQTMSPQQQQTMSPQQQQQTMSPQQQQQTMSPQQQQQTMSPQQQQTMSPQQQQQTMSPQQQQQQTISPQQQQTMSPQQQQQTMSPQQQTMPHQEQLQTMPPQKQQTMSPQ
ncbi:involucrin-like [Ostrea edulis]|uniref:involucrin-like n=1 Tax=Ostrea edulis TaxID=37623 RepID=UPI0024AF38ED|nr:involucrin-like [Ostrea edulis]